MPKPEAAHMVLSVKKILVLKLINSYTSRALYLSLIVALLVGGLRNIKKSESIQNRCFRYFLGFHKFTPLLCISGDIGVISCRHRRWVNMLRLWNRILKMADNRLPKTIFNYDYNCIRKSWCSEIKHIMVNVNHPQTYESKIPIDVEQFKQEIFVKESENWQNESQKMAKLRTFRIFKQTFGQEAYLCSNISKIERSHLAQFRFGILPLKIETGRFIGQALPERTCNLCQLNAIENEIHFLIK